MLSYVFDRLIEVEDIQRVIIGTNLRFAQQFKEWSDSNSERRVDVVADRSYSEAEKPGAIASLARIAREINDSCLIVAGDNLFTSDLRPMIRAFKDKSCATVALYDIRDKELAKQYSTAIMDPEGMIIDFREKPAKPETTLIGTCIYMLPQRTLRRLNEYLISKADRDSPGRFIAWLCKREPVYGHVLDGYWWDIGTIDQYYEASQTLQIEKVVASSSLGTYCPAVRKLRDLEPVLYDPSSCEGIDQELPVYQVYRDVCSGAERDMLRKHGLRYDVTIMPPLKLGKEYVKTLGHDHISCKEGWSHPEVFEVLEGEACFLIQKSEDGKLVDVALMEAQSGEKVLIPPNCGHVMINVSSDRLVTGNLISRFCLRTSSAFIQRKGGAYYLLEEGKIVRNKNYRSLPNIRVISAGSFSPHDLDSMHTDNFGLLLSLLKRPESFSFLNYPWKANQTERAEHRMVRGFELNSEMPAIGNHLTYSLDSLRSRRSKL